MKNSRNHHYSSPANRSRAIYAAIIVGHEREFLALFTIHSGFLSVKQTQVGKNANASK
ncbi:MAG: hypothetical protein ACJAW0_001169 [Zhongshania sp.]|jgi:hypothetical protein